MLAGEDEKSKTESVLVYCRCSWAWSPVTAAFSLRAVLLLHRLNLTTTATPALAVSPHLLMARVGHP